MFVSTVQRQVSNACAQPVSRASAFLVGVNAWWEPSTLCELARPAQRPRDRRTTTLGGPGFAPLAPAPGSYVHQT